jgi:hypothetical protein
MRLRGAAAVLGAVLPLAAAGSDPRPKAADYPAHAAMPKAAIGAEYLVRSFSGHNRTFAAPDHLVVEVAVYPAPEEKLPVSTRHFSLRLNGKREVLLPQSPGAVAASMKYPDWERRRRVEAIGGVGDGGVILGRPQPVERFPGDPRPGQTRLPAPPRAPAPEDRAASESEQPVRAEDVLVEFELPEGDAARPVSGYLYFYFKGKTKSIRSLELVYQGPGGNTTLRLR